MLLMMFWFGHGKIGNKKDAMKLYCEMVTKGSVPKLSTHNGLISDFAKKIFHVEDDLENSGDIVAEVDGGVSPNSNSKLILSSGEMNGPIDISTTVVADTDFGNREELGEEGVVEKNKRISDGMVEAHGFLIGPASIELCSSGSDSIIAWSGVGIPLSDFKPRVFPGPKKDNNSDRRLVGRVPFYFCFSVGVEVFIHDWLKLLLRVDGVLHCRDVLPELGLAWPLLWSHYI
ncbi:hypothetical protein L1049_001558 [Liquidambar formosana]|uniref:Pentatricopeptide repeat-containing protein n=1 Tax=Liquidambar formosana TaxID=63359 RepID=A0AAP0NDH8_LIQFO